MNVVIFAAKDNRLIAGVLVSVAFALVAIFLIASAMSSRRRRSAVPAALRPGPSDEELESRTLPRFLAVGSLFLILMAVYLPAYWLREPTRIRLKEEQFLRESIARGEILYQEHAPEGTRGAHFSANCARCHGPEGEGTVQPFKELFTYAEPPLKYIVARYKAAGRKDPEIRQIIVDAIERGRPGTLMPAWSQAFGGPLLTQQVDDVVNFIYSIQETPAAAAKDIESDGAALFDANCAVCHTAKRKGEGPALFWGGIGPDLRTVIQQLGPAEVRATIHDGRLNYTRSSMPSWAFLGDTALDALVAFLQSIADAPDEYRGAR